MIFGLRFFCDSAVKGTLGDFVEAFKSTTRLSKMSSKPEAGVLKLKLNFTKTSTEICFGSIFTDF